MRAKAADQRRSAGFQRSRPRCSRKRRWAKRRRRSPAALSLERSATAKAAPEAQIRRVDRPEAARPEAGAARRASA